MPMAWLEWFTPEVRRWIYRVGLALGALAVGMKWAGESTVALIMAVVAAILGNGLALPNVPITELPITDEPLPAPPTPFDEGRGMPQ